jgi:hypothetical protein
MAILSTIIGRLSESFRVTHPHDCACKTGSANHVVIQLPAFVQHGSVPLVVGGQVGQERTALPDTSHYRRPARGRLQASAPPSPHNGS